MAWPSSAAKSSSCSPMRVQMRGVALRRVSEFSLFRYSRVLTRSKSWYVFRRPSETERINCWKLSSPRRRKISQSCMYVSLYRRKVQDVQRRFSTVR